jgi:hypothetical protein
MGAAWPLQPLQRASKEEGPGQSLNQLRTAGTLCAGYALLHCHQLFKTSQRLPP